VGIDPKIEEDATRAEKKKKKKKSRSDKSDRVQVHTLPLPLLLYNLDILIVWIDKVGRLWCIICSFEDVQRLKRSLFIDLGEDEQESCALSSRMPVYLVAR
jgi:hypothetical protein